MANVTIFTTPTCVYCKMTKEFFKVNEVQYQEKNVATDTEAREDMIKRSGQLGVPVIDVDGKIVVGFDKARLAELLGIKK
ncbi:glutaredoxin family protein [Candidatus Giovannonibacteria bacterium]|nr:glutaredoxin family protein [Candidatus Giovannonibacteria bacterium]